MKYSRAFLEKRFDQLYQEASSIMQDRNPCQIGRGKCHSMREYPERHKNQPFCCGGCQHLTPKGCSVESLFCKLWVCEALEDEHRAMTSTGKVELSPMLQALAKIKKKAMAYGLLVYRGTKEVSIQNALWNQENVKP